MASDTLNTLRQVGRYNRIWPVESAITASSGSSRGGARLLDDDRSGVDPGPVGGSAGSVGTAARRRSRSEISGSTLRTTRYVLPQVVLLLRAPQEEVPRSVRVSRPRGKSPRVRRADRVSKTKVAHLFQVRHRDEVEAPVTDWLEEAYNYSVRRRRRSLRHVRSRSRHVRLRRRQRRRSRRRRRRGEGAGVVRRSRA